MAEYKFAPGSVFQWRDRTLKIMKLLGTGMTADVFLAESENELVAIKVLKPGSSDEKRIMFIKEPENLTRVGGAWSEAYPDSPVISPRYYGAEMDTETPFIVMELIQGEKLVDLVQQTSGLKEEQAYWLGVQLGRLLTLLHTRLERCYPDMKIDNFWVMENPSNPNRPFLRILDWSILSEKDPDDVARDLFFASLIMNFIFTASIPEYSQIRILTGLDEAKKFPELSSGTKQFLNRSLSNNMARRFPSSEAWYAEVSAMQELWSMEGDDLLATAITAWNSFQEFMDQEKHDRAADEYRFARMSLEIAMDKGVYNEELEEYWEKIKHHEATQSSLGRGKISLWGVGFEKAIEYFSEGADIYPQQADILWRWAWLARGAYSLGADLFREVREDLFKALEHLLEGKSTAAESLFSKVADQLQAAGAVFPDGLRFLASESRILNLCSEAADKQTMRQYDAAVSLLKEAVELYNKLPVDPPVQWADAYGDISKLLDEAIKEKRTLGESKDHLTRAINYLDNRNFEDAAKEFRMAFSTAQESPEINNAWIRAVRELLGQGEYEAAWILTRKSFGLSINEEMDKLFRVSQDLDYLGQKASDTITGEFLSRYRLVASLSYYQEFLQGSAGKKLLDAAFQGSLRSSDFPSAYEIGREILMLWPERVDSIHKHLEEAARNSVALMHKAALASFMDAARVRLELAESQDQAYQIIKSALALLNISIDLESSPEYGEQVQQIQQIMQDLGGRLEATAEARRKYYMAREQSRQTRITKIQNEIRSLLDQMETAYPVTMEKRLAKAMSLLAEWEILGSDDDPVYEELRSLLFHTVTVFGNKAWKEIIHEADYLLEGGYSEQARYLLDDLDNLFEKKMTEIIPEYASIREKMDAVARFEDRAQRQVN